MKQPKIIFKHRVNMVLISTLLICGMSCVKPTQESTAVHYKSATELAGAIRRGEIKSVDLLNIYLDRIERFNGDINAVVALDIEAAMARAIEADKALAQGQNWGPLHGLPMTVKDVFNVTGMPTTLGDTLFKDFMPESNALAVQRLIDAGAIIFGKTNLPLRALDVQSYNNVYGTTNNPWDLSRTPGGSSGGSAASLAMGFTSLELGSDLGGSIRIPAHFTGVYGHKPTFGIVPRYGGYGALEVVPTTPLWVVGPLARSVDDLELALEVLTTSSSDNENNNKHELLPPRQREFSDYRVAVWFTDPYPRAEIDADVLTALQKTVEKLRHAGLNIEEARPDIDMAENYRIHWDIWGEVEAGALPLDEALAASQENYRDIWAAFFEHYDVLLAPASPTVAFPHNQKASKRTTLVNGQEKPYWHIFYWPGLAIVAELPATVAPVGFSDSGLPVGIQIIGARFEDRTTIDFARGLSELVGGFVAPPNYKD